MFGQLFVHLAQQSIGGRSLFAAHVRDLLRRMNARIGAPSAMQFHFATQSMLSGLAQFAHHGAGVFLFLPTAVAGAVVFDRQFPGQATRLAEFEFRNGRILIPGRISLDEHARASSAQ